MIMLKIAIDSGHGLNTQGKEVPAYIGMGKIKEWELNDKITAKVISMLTQYENVKVLRLDDNTGKKDIPLGERTLKANNFKADIMISNHHNAGIGGKNGGGLVVYRYPKSTKFTKDMQKLLYNCLIAETGLKGNRTSPLAESNLHMVRETNMPAVLIEHGFMDSPSDMKEIIKEDFSTKSARGIIKFLEKQYGIKKKQIETPKQILYRVQTGAFKNLAYAINLRDSLICNGYNTYMVQNNGLYKVQVGAFAKKENADRLANELENKGYDTYITTQEGKAVNIDVEPKILQVGSQVKVRQGAKTYEGKDLAYFVYNETYDVIQISGNRVVIGKGKTVTAAVNKSDLILI